MKYLIGLLILPLVLLTGCQKPGSVDKIPGTSYPWQPVYGDTLVQGSIADPAILNPILASDSASHSVTGLVFNSLLRFDKNLNFEGELARSWDIEDEGKKITFHLRPHIYWHDGVTLTAEDVLFSYQSYMNPLVKTAYRSNYETISKAVVLDAQTFRVYYQEPFAPALQSLAAMAIIPKHLLEGKDLNTADSFNQYPIGSGPYRFESWKRAETIRLISNHDYFEGRPYLDRVILRVIPDMSVQFLELRHGSIDMMDLTPNQYHREGSEPAFLKRFNKYRYPALQYTYLGFNLKNPLFQDVRVRRAIAMSIDRKALVQSVLEGLGTVATGPYTPSSKGFNPQVAPIPYDPAGAKKLFETAGFTYSSLGQLLKNGQPVRFTIQTNQGNLNREQTATIIQSQLKAVGIEVQIRIIAWSTFLEEFINKRKFDAVVMGWSLAYDPDLYDIWHSSKTGEHEFNFISYQNTKVDQLLRQGRRTFIEKERERLYHEIHRLIADDVPCVFLYVPDSIPAVHRRIQNIKVEKAGIGYNFIQWFVPAGYHKYQP
jgi:peptide/nickel transport system substrate-binding protein